MIVKEIKAVFIAVLFCIVFTLLLVAFSYLRSLVPSAYERFAYGVIGTGAALLATYVFLRFHKRTFADIGLRFEHKTVVRFAMGIIIGIILMGSCVAFVINYSGLEIIPNEKGTVLNFLFWTSPLILLAVMEEIGFRAYPLVILKEKLGIRGAIVITSILFALYHIPNGWSVKDAFLGPGIMGLIFGLAAVYSNGIALPAGIHYAVNLTTSAFGSRGNMVCLWMVTEPAEVQGNALIAGIAPNIGILILAVVLMEWYIKTTRKEFSP